MTRFQNWTCWYFSPLFMWLSNSGVLSKWQGGKIKFISLVYSRFIHNWWLHSETLDIHLSENGFYIKVICKIKEDIPFEVSDAAETSCLVSAISEITSSRLRTDDSLEGKFSRVNHRNFYNFPQIGRGVVQSHSEPLADLGGVPNARRGVHVETRKMVNYVWAGWRRANRSSDFCRGKRLINQLYWRGSCACFLVSVSACVFVSVFAPDFEEIRGLRKIDVFFSAGLYQVTFSI